MTRTARRRVPTDGHVKRTRLVGVERQVCLRLAHPALHDLVHRLGAVVHWVDEGAVLAAGWAVRVAARHQLGGEALSAMRGRSSSPMG